MAQFDPETFDDEKYVEYFTELQEAYKRAFETMNARFDKTLVHAIDQQVLNESEPVYEEGAFRVDLPEEPYERLTGVAVDRDRFETVLERYVEELRAELDREFDAR
jgi:hypothetical protein